MPTKRPLCIYAGRIEEMRLTDEVLLPSYTRRSDDRGGGVVYRGEAQPGSSETAPVWRISRITVTNDSASEVFANGSAEFLRVWADRDTYVYA